MSNFFKNLKQEKLDKGLELLDACLDDIAYARMLLTKNNHDVNWKDDAGGNSLLHMLVYNELFKPVQLLLKHGADPNIVNKNEETPLHWCATMNSKKCAKVLIEYKCNIDCVDNSGSTPLHYAASTNNLEMIPLLLDNGASVNIMDKDGLTAIELSAEGKSTAAYAVTILLLRYYQQNNLPLPKLVKKNISRFLTQPNQPPPSYAPPAHTLASTANLNSTTTSALITTVNTPLPPHLSAQYTQAIREAAHSRIQSDLENEGSSPKRKLKKKIVKQPEADKLSPLATSSIDFNIRPTSPKAALIPINAAPLSKSPSAQPSVAGSMTTPTQQLVLEMGQQVVQVNDETELVHHNSMKTIAETLFPPTPFPPLLPCKAAGTKYMDVIVVVEHCVDCETHNKLSLRHDSVQYARVANEVLFGIIKSVIEQKFAIRLFAYRTKSTKYDGKFGGLEVAMAVNLTPQLSVEAQQLIAKNTAANKIQNRKHSSLDFSASASMHSRSNQSLKSLMDPIVIKQPSEDALESSVELKANHQNWATHQIWSKLDSKCWPNINFVKDKAVAFLTTTLKEHSTNIVNDHHSSDGEEDREGSVTKTPPPAPHVETQYKHTSFSVAQIKDIQSSYSEWVERMKLPPIIERHKLDMDWPHLFPNIDDTTASTVSSKNKPPPVVHASGPMLDLELKEKVRKVDFEKAFMKHFLVYDCTL